MHQTKYLLRTECFNQKLFQNLKKCLQNGIRWWFLVFLFPLMRKWGKKSIANSTENQKFNKNTPKEKNNVRYWFPFHEKIPKIAASACSSRSAKVCAAVCLSLGPFWSRFMNTGMKVRLWWLNSNRELWQRGVYSCGSECSHFSSLFWVPCKITQGRAWPEDGSSFSWHLLILLPRLMFANKFQSLRATRYVLRCRVSTGCVCTPIVLGCLAPKEAQWLRHVLETTLHAR